MEALFRRPAGAVFLGAGIGGSSRLRQSRDVFGSRARSVGKAHGHVQFGVAPGSRWSMEDRARQRLPGLRLREIVSTSLVPAFVLVPPAPIFALLTFAGMSPIAILRVPLGFEPVPVCPLFVLVPRMVIAPVRIVDPN